MPRSKFKIKGKQWIYVFIVFVMLLLMMGLNARLSEFFRLYDQKNQMQERIDNLQATSVALDTQIAYADSDKAVEEWVRTYERAVLPGDIAIIPHPDQEITPELHYINPPGADAKENWRAWWELFFE